MPLCWGGPWGKLEVKDDEQDGKDRMHRVVIATGGVKPGTVFRLQGVVMTVAASEAMSQEEQDFHRTISTSGEGAVLAAHDPEQSCLLRYVKRAQQLCMQNVKAHVHEGQVYMTPCRAIRAGEPLLEFWEWEGDKADERRAADGRGDDMTFWINLGECMTGEDDNPEDKDDVHWEV